MQGSFYDGDDRNRYRGYQSATRVGDRTYSPYGPNVASPLDPPPAPERRPLAGLDSIDSMEIDSEEIDAMPDPPPQEAPTIAPDDPNYMPPGYDPFPESTPYIDEYSVEPTIYGFFDEPTPIFTKKGRPFHVHHDKDTFDEGRKAAWRSRHR